VNNNINLLPYKYIYTLEYSLENNIDSNVLVRIRSDNEDQDE